MARRTVIALGAAAVAPIAVAQDAPVQMHLAYAGTTVGSAMVASYMTNGPTTTSTCNFGTSPSSLTSSATGTQTSYLDTWHHHVTMTGLTPATTYYYQCGDAAAGFSATFNFTSAKTTYPLNVVLIGDMGNYNSEHTFMDLPRVVPESDFIWHIGDISYADDAFLHDPIVFGYEATYNKYMNDMQPYTSVKAYMTVPGNHEAECHSPVCFLNSTLREALGNFSAYNHRFRMPSDASNGTLNMWYSYDVGRVHFVVVDTETDYPNAPNDDYASKNGGFGNQLSWLKSDLAAASARRAAGDVDWIIAAGHRPMYSRACARGDGAPDGECASTTAAFEPLFASFGVDVFFCGHMHSTEVQFPVYKNVVWGNFTAPPYTAYVVTGAAGCDEGFTSYGGAPHTAWNAYTNDADYGLSVMTVNDAKSLTWAFRRGVDGAVLNTFTLTRA